MYPGVEDDVAFSEHQRGWWPSASIDSPITFLDEDGRFFEEPGEGEGEGEARPEEAARPERRVASPLQQDDGVLFENRLSEEEVRTAEVGTQAVAELPAMMGACMDCQFSANVIRRLYELLKLRTSGAMIIRQGVVPVYDQSEIGRDDDRVCTIPCLMNHGAQRLRHQDATVSYRLQNQPSCFGNVLAYIPVYQREMTGQTPESNFITMGFRDDYRESLPKIYEKCRTYCIRMRVGLSRPNDKDGCFCLTLHYVTGETAP